VGLTVRYVLCAGEAAAVVARLAAEDGKLLVGGNVDVGEDLGGAGTAIALCVEERERVAPDTVFRKTNVSPKQFVSILLSREILGGEDLRVKDTRALAAIVGEKDEVLGLLGLGVVVRGAVPVLARGGRLGLGSRVGDCRGRRRRAGVDTGIGIGNRRGGGHGGSRGRRRRGGRGRTVVDLFPGDDVAVDGGGDPFGALVLLLGLVELLMAVAALRLAGGAGGGDFLASLLVLARQGVDGHLLDVDGTAKVKGQLKTHVSICIKDTFL
jgi:hypothetical protein